MASMNNNMKDNVDNKTDQNQIQNRKDNNTNNRSNNCVNSRPNQQQQQQQNDQQKGRRITANNQNNQDSQANNRYNNMNTNKPDTQKQNEKENEPNNSEDYYNNAGGGGGNNKGGKGGKYGFRNGPRDDRDSKLKSKADDRLLERLLDKLMSISGPTLDLPPSVIVEKKFASKCRLYIGNVSNEVNEDDLLELFRPYGESTELFLNKEKNFAFIRMDYKVNADKAKQDLDGFFMKGRPIKVRFAPINAGIRVKYLNSSVTNELLELAFGVFGDIERAVVLVDERGNSKNEGIVEYSRRSSAVQACKKCNDGVYFLTEALKPVIVEPLELVDTEEGLSEKTISKKSCDYFKQRSVGPRFATAGSFEFEYGTRWKQLYELYKQKEEALHKELKAEEEKLDAQMEFARYENETEQLREQLRQREIDRERQKMEWELKERLAEEQRRCDEESMRRQAEELHLRMQQQDEELRRRHQENSLFMQEHMRNNGAPAPPGYSPPVDPLRESYEAMAATGSIPAVMYLTLKNRESNYYY